MGKITEEMWRIVPGYQNYEASSDGRVRSIDRIEFRAKNARCDEHVQSRRGSLVKPQITRDGYLYVKVSGKKEKIHRLVAMSFLPNPNLLSQVNHINGDKTDNRVENLEWSTPSHNLKHKYLVIGHKGTCTGKFSKLHPSSKKVTAISMTTGVIRAFDCANDAIREGCATDSGSISKACSGKYASHNGYFWVQA